MTTTTQKRQTLIADTLCAHKISSRIYHAKSHGYRELQAELKELRDMGAIVLKERLNVTKAALEAIADKFIKIFLGLIPPA